MRIGVGQLWQETNTFNPVATIRDDFEAFGVLRGQDVVEQMAQTNELGGFIQSLVGWPERPEIVGLVRLGAWPGGAATRATFDWLRHGFISAIERVLSLDGLLLALHGALVADEHPDVEGEVLAEVRRLVGSRVPVVATLDLHAHVTPLMVEHADALVLYHTAPHVDVYETGARGANLLRRILVEHARPTTAYQRIPMVVPAERANTEIGRGMSFDFKQALRALEARPEILAAGLATVQPWLDVPDLGSAILVVADQNAALAREECYRLADIVWQRREEYLPALVAYDAAIREAHENRHGLVVLGDGADATTSGAGGDNTHILEELLKYDWPRGALAAMVSPAVVRQAKQCGEGAPIATRIGGARDNRFCQPLRVKGAVERLFAARFVMSGHLARNLSVDMGDAAVLRLGNVRLVVTSRSGPHFAPELFRAAGLDPLAASVLVAKSPCGFRAVYEGHAVRIVHMASVGCAPSDFWNYEYGKISRPLWPWDALPEWQPNPVIYAS